MRSMCVGVAETGVKAFLFLTFAALFVSEKREKKEKLLYVKDNTSSTAIAVPSPAGEGLPSPSTQTDYTILRCAI